MSSGKPDCQVLQTRLVADLHLDHAVMEWAVLIANQHFLQKGPFFKSLQYLILKSEQQDNSELQ